MFSAARPILTCIPTKRSAPILYSPNSTAERNRHALRLRNPLPLCNRSWPITRPARTPPIPATPSAFIARHRVRSPRASFFILEANLASRPIIVPALLAEILSLARSDSTSGDYWSDTRARGYRDPAPAQRAERFRNLSHPAS